MSRGVRAILVIVVTAVTSLPLVGLAGEPMSAARLLEMERARYAAMVAADTAALSPILDDDLVFTHASGRIDTKASLLERLGAGTLNYVAISVDDARPRLFGDAGVITGRSTIDVLVGNEERRLELRFTSVWARAAEGWRIVAYQSTSDR